MANDCPTHCPADSRDSREGWDGIERRDAPQHITLDRVELMIAEAVEERLLKTEEKIMTTLHVQMGQIRAVFEQHVHEAFPHGDTHGHRNYHLKSITAAEKWDKIVTNLTEKAISGVVVAAAGFLAMAAWEYVKSQVTK